MTESLENLTPDEQNPEENRESSLRGLNQWLMNECRKIDGAARDLRSTSQKLPKRPEDIPTNVSKIQGAEQIIDYANEYWVAAHDLKKGKTEQATKILQTRLEALDIMLGNASSDKEAEKLKEKAAKTREWLKLLESS